MRVALLTTFAASRKEPLLTMMDRVHQAFLDAGLGEPMIRFDFGDGLLPSSISSVDRVLKRHPELERFVSTASPMPGILGARRISNGPSPAAGDVVPYTTLRAIAAGVPRSFPFQGVSIHFHTLEFGELASTPSNSAEMLAGVLVTDSWWVNGRIRSLLACTVVEADPGSKQLPSPPAAVAAVLEACGKIKRTVQAPLAGRAEASPAHPVRLPSGPVIASANPEAARVVKVIVADYRARLKDIVERAALPHDLPPPAEAMRDTQLGVASGPRKPALDRVFKPMGYTCRGGSGTFTLRRRTPRNLTVELRLDVGTWGHKVLAMFLVWGLGFKATLVLPVSASGVIGAQYPIGDADRWQKIVENLAALVKELERTFVAEIEAAVDPSPEWYRPES